jgi:hypothetical protein
VRVWSQMEGKTRLNFGCLLIIIFFDILTTHFFAHFRLKPRRRLSNFTIKSKK